MYAKSRSGSKDFGSFLFALIILLLVAGVVVGIFTLRSDPVDQLLAEDRIISVLFVIEHEGRPLSTYVLMSYPETRRAAVFEIPNETGLLIQRINRVDRIDAVYNPRSVTDYKDVIQNLLGTDIPFSIVFDIDNLARTVDLIGGVDVFIPSRVDIRGPDTLVLLPSGVNRLGGDKIRDFLTLELPTEDREAAVFRRQRFFLSFIRRLAEKNDMLRHPSVSPLYHSFMRTNLNPRTRIRLFNEIARMDLERINVQSVGGNRREISGQTLLLPFYGGNLIRDTVRQALGALVRPVDGLMGDRIFTVEVLNGTTINGLAGRTAEFLRGFGFDVISTGNADHSGHARTLVIDRSGYEDIARGFANIIRCTNIRFDPPARVPVWETSEGFDLQYHEIRADFTLILGRDFDGRFVTN